MWRPTLALLALSAAACSRTRDIPVAELPRVVSELREGRQVEVVSTQGERVRIESFSRVEIRREGPCWESGCRVTQLLKLDQPLEARLVPSGLEVSGLAGRKQQRVVKLVPLDRSRTWAQLSERSASRGLITGGVAAATALSVGIGVAAYVGSKGDANDDLLVVQQLLAGTAAGATAGGITLLITVPLTRDLGTEL